MRPAVTARMQSSSAPRTSGTREGATSDTFTNPRQHSLPTVPESDATPSPSASPVEINKPIWAVDLGDEIRALSTFDLWMGLSRGELSTEVRVWRMGRECWTAAREVPELACALSPESAAGAVSDEALPDRVTLDYSARRETQEHEAAEAAQRGDPLAVVVDVEASPARQREPSTLAGHVREPRRLARARKLRRHVAAVAASAAAVVLFAIGLGASPREAAHASERRSAPARATAQGVEPVDLAAGGRVPAPRTRRVSPTHAGQQRHR